MQVECLNFAILHISANEHESTMSIDFDVANKYI